MADSAAIQEANKVRLSLGLPALPVPGQVPSGPVFKETESDPEEEQGSTLESRQAEGYENWKNLERDAEEKARRDAKNFQIKKARDAAKRFAKLEGKGLGDEPDEPELDTRAWLKGQKKRQKKAQKVWKLEQELAEREEQAQYTSADLAGVKVGHEVDQFEEGSEQVLTLKDTTIEENEEDGDELENINMKDQERVTKRLDLKRKKPIYDPNNTDDVPGSILAQYDEEINSKIQKRFTLDGKGRTEESKAALRSTIGEKMKAQPISLDFLADAPAPSDYQDISEIKIRKKKKSKSSRRKAIDEEDEILPLIPSAPDDNAMEVDVKPDVSTTVRKPVELASLIDDDDLQAALASQRRQTLKKLKRIRPEDIAQQMRDELNGNTEAMQQDSDREEGGLVIDETSEFIANLQRPSTPEPVKRLKRSGSPEMTKMATDSPDSDVEMGESYNEVDEQKPVADAGDDYGVSATGLADDDTLTNGIGATLSMLTQRGLITKSDAGDRNATYRERQKFLAEKQKREAAAVLKARQQRQRDRTSGKLDKLSTREREEHARWMNSSRDQQESRQMAEVFNREYKPDVELKYVDEYGRNMGQKEAFKHLSHQFHGKGSGKGKTEKKLKKIEEEKRKEAQSALDSSKREGYDKAMGATAKKNRQAGVRLA
ncbi:MAG: hypothetical protein M1814_005408 [Vezdaea aestivalis]|nr:MAG: hypothetical protein M1814_005408 [Vezdaea aestivalis]